MTGLTIWSSENSGNPLGSYRDKTVLTGPGNIFKAFLIMKSKFIEYIVLKQVVSRGGGGGYSHTLPIRVCAAQRGCDFEAPDLEQGIHFRGVF